MPKNPVVLGLLEPKKRKYTAKSRLHGLLKKAGEWTILCDTELLIIAVTSQDKVVTSYTTDPKGSVLNHLQRFYDIYNKWENKRTDSDHYCMNYDKRTVMQRFGGPRRVMYIDPRKKEQLLRKKKKYESVGVVSMKDLASFNQRFAELIQSFKDLQV